MARRGRAPSETLGDTALRLRAAKLNGHARDVDPQMAKRQMLAEFCRLIGALHGTTQPNGSPDVMATASPRHVDEINALPPRLRQTLVGLLQGDSEKQVAAKLQLSPHTVHVYVKSLYRRFRVASRGELLARWVASTASTR